MSGECYRPDEILGLEGNEPHLSQCATCRSLHSRGKSFLGEVRWIARTAAAAGESWKAGQAARRAVEGRLARPSDALHWAAAEGRAATPELILACCEHSRDSLIESPNAAQGWLEAAEDLFARIPSAEDPWRDRDRKWAHARLKAMRGNLLLFRGHILPGHTLLEEARAAYEALGEDFQVALSAPSIAYALAKLGRPLEGKALCIHCDRILREYGVVKGRAGLLSTLALIWLALSEHRKARLVFDYLLAHLDLRDSYALTIRRNAVLPLVETRAWESALDSVEALARDLAGSDLNLERGRTLRLKGEILLLMGNIQPGLDVLREAETLLTPLGVGYESAQLDALLGQAYLAMGLHREARKGLNRALRFYAAEGFALDLIQIMEAWNRAAEEKRSSDREFAAFRRYWQFVPASNQAFR